jgi:hypothetical protein
MNSDYNLNKFNHGTEFADRTVLLNQSFAQIEKDNLDFFSARPHPFDKNDHDRLDVHLIFVFTSELGHRFGFNEQYDLPEKIKEQCLLALQSHFPN